MAKVKVRGDYVVTVDFWGKSKEQPSRLGGGWGATRLGVSVVWNENQNNTVGIAWVGKKKKRNCGR